MRVALILVPYDLGRERVGTGRGPEAYVQGGAVEALRERGHDVAVTTVERPSPFTEELDAVITVNQALARAVTAAAASDRLPLVVAGNCNASLGLRAGLLAAGAPAGLPVVWFDAHGDFNTPATTVTGYLDGMPLAMLTGAAHPETWLRLGGRAVAEDLVVHLGARELDPAEAVALDGSRVRVVAPAAADGRLEAALAAALEGLPGGGPATGAGARPPLQLHVDLDVLDPRLAPGVSFPSPNGLTPTQLRRALAVVGRHFTPAGLTLSSYLPERDDGGASTLQAGIDVLVTVADLA